MAWASRDQSEKSDDDQEQKKPWHRGSGARLQMHADGDEENGRQEAGREAGEPGFDSLEHGLADGLSEEEKACDVVDDKKQSSNAFQCGCPGGMEARQRQRIVQMGIPWRGVLHSVGPCICGGMETHGKIFYRAKRVAYRDANLNALKLFAAHRAAVARALVRHVSHGLVQPLTALMNYVQVGMTQLEQARSDTESWRPLFDQMQRYAEEAVATIRQLRGTLDGIPAPHEPFELNAAVRDAVEFMLQEARQQDIEVNLHLASELPTVKGDLFELIQAVVEVLRNSFEAIQEAASNRREVTVYTGLSDRSEIELRVQDTGATVSGGEIDRIFEPFFTTKPGKLGLGLAAARATVEAHGGHILGRLNDDVGVTVLFRIPTDNKKMRTLEQASDEKTVYVVDDEEGVRESLRPLIESVGLRVETYASATEFLEKYKADAPSCLLLDVRMPGMSGLELQEILAARGISLPVLVITGYADVPTAVQAMKTGALDFVEKPFNKQELLEKIQGAIARDQRVKEANAERAAILARMETLTPREAEVMGRVVAGQANKVIAIELDISKKTVEAHRARVMEKMGVRTVAQLVQASMIARGYPSESAAPAPNKAGE